MLPLHHSRLSSTARIRTEIFCFQGRCNPIEAFAALFCCQNYKADVLSATPPVSRFPLRKGNHGSIRDSGILRCLTGIRTQASDRLFDFGSPTPSPTESSSLGEKRAMPYTMGPRIYFSNIWRRRRDSNPELMVCNHDPRHVGRRRNFWSGRPGSNRHLNVGNVTCRAATPRPLKTACREGFGPSPPPCVLSPGSTLWRVVGTATKLTTPARRRRGIEPLPQGGVLPVKLPTCSAHLYGAPTGNRTRTPSLEGLYTTIIRQARIVYSWPFWFLWSWESESNWTPSAFQTDVPTTTPSQALAPRLRIERRPPALQAGAHTSYAILGSIKLVWILTSSALRSVSEGPVRTDAN